MTYWSVEEMNLIALIDSPKESRMAAIVKLTRRMDELDEAELDEDAFHINWD